MNLTQFEKKLKGVCEKMTREELLTFLYGIAYCVPESHREKVIQNAFPAAERVDVRQDLPIAARNIDKELDKINAGEIRLDSAEICEYHEWYDDDDVEFSFSDPHGVFKIVDAAFEILHKYVDAEMFEEAYPLADKLASLGITVEGAYSEYGLDEPMYLGDGDLLTTFQYDYQRFLTEGAYSAYRSKGLDERINELCYWLFSGHSYGVTLSSLLSLGPVDRNEFKIFLDAWIDCLASYESSTATALLFEALDLADDKEATLAAARKYFALHPEIYLKAQEDSSQDASRVIEIGKEALNTVPAPSTIRAKIALLTAKHADALKQTDDKERCWIEAFRSKPNATGFLRLLCECEDFEKHAAEVKDIIAKHKLHSEPDYSLLLLSGDYRTAFNKGMVCDKALGWSGSFLKEGLALFLLCICRDDTYNSGCMQLCRFLTGSLMFEAEEYYAGMTESKTNDRVKLFMRCFQLAKKHINMQKDDLLNIVDILEELISFRVEGIMQNNRRNYYDECAMYIAAMGEVKESLGEPNGRNNYMRSYKEKYYRRHAFTSELKSLGMRV